MRRTTIGWIVVALAILAIGIAPVSLSRRPVAADSFTSAGTPAPAATRHSPNVCRLSDGRLMVVFYAGYGHVSMPCPQLPKGGRICFCTSADEGHTWSKAELLYDSPDDDRDPSIVQLKNGRLICNFFSLRKPAPPGNSWIGLGTWIVTSDDLGKTWSPPRRLFDSYYSSAPFTSSPAGG